MTVQDADLASDMIADGRRIRYALLRELRSPFNGAAARARFEAEERSVADDLARLEITLALGVERMTIAEQHRFKGWPKG